MKQPLEVGLWPQHTNGRTKYTPFIRDANLKILEVGEAKNILDATITAQVKVAHLQASGYAAVFFDTRAH